MSIIIYTKTGCPWCKEALEFLKEKGLDYEEREVLSNSSYFKELVEKSGQQKAPTIDFNGEILADTDADAINAFLKGKGLV